MNEHVTSLMAEVKAKNPAEPEFHQAVQEVVESLALVLDRHPEYRHAKILERIIEPERVIIFRVPWVDDQGQVRVNRGFRIQMNSAIGPYKGGLRFHPSVNLGILKFLAFEQVFKNSLTTLPMGGGKGGSDFDPKGKSDNEVMALLPGLHDRALPSHRPRHRRTGRRHRRRRPRDRLPLRLYKKLRNEFTGVLTGKGARLGRLPHPPGGDRLWLRLLLRRRCSPRASRRSRARPASSPAAATSRSTRSRSCWTWAPSPSPSPTPRATSTTRRASTATSSSSSMDLKNVRRGRIKEYADKFKGVSYVPVDPKLDHNPLWDHKAACAFPSATQNEINGKDAANLLRNGVTVVGEGANMPSTIDAVNQFLDAKILYGPGKAANAGGVATSGLEMSQNSMRLGWTPRGGRRQAPRHHEEHPPGLLRDRRALRHARQLRQRRQHRRLPQGRQRDDGPGRRLTFLFWGALSRAPQTPATA